MKVLVLNVGSSSVKFELIETSLEDIEKGTEKKLGRGLVDKIGMTNATVKFSSPDKPAHISTPPIWDHQSAIKQVLKLLTDPEIGIVQDVAEIDAIGHRVVHGGESSRSVLITPEVVGEDRATARWRRSTTRPTCRASRRARASCPTCRMRRSSTPPSTRSMPEHAYIYALPYELYKKHPSAATASTAPPTATCLARAPSIAGRRATSQRSSPATSATALGRRHRAAGNRVDTSMGFTPLEGLVMGTRCGDIDPAVILHIMAKEKTLPARVEHTC